ncbi:MAG: putative transposase [Solirubrobacteraceae bacterium]|jgi:putative transposase|nr:putative transposase [Solirubrobacteraceae bacterium]
MGRRASTPSSSSPTASGSPASAWSVSCAGITALRPKKRGRTTIRVPGVRVCEDLVDRGFLAVAPNRLWVADITYLRTWEGWLYLVAVQDLFSRRIVGWSMADHMRTELVTDALQMALARRRPQPGLIWHSDQGSQFVSLALRPAGARCRHRAVDGLTR